MKKTKFQPLGDRVIVEPEKAAEKTSGGIIIPEMAKEKPQRGTVVACGKGRRDEPMTVKVGDVVIYDKHGCAELEIDGEKILMMREGSIIAIV